jgi:hypothetical protein
MVKPSGLRMLDAIFAGDLVRATPMNDLRLHRVLIAFFIANAWPSTFEWFEELCSEIILFVQSRYASSMLVCSKISA